MQAVRVVGVLRVRGAAWRNPVLPERLAGVVVGDDVFRGGIRDRICGCDFLSHREPVVCDGRLLARGITRWALYGSDQFHRALRARAWRGVSFGACGGVGCESVGGLGCSALAGVWGSVAGA